MESAVVAETECSHDGNQYFEKQMFSYMRLMIIIALLTWFDFNHE